MKLTQTFSVISLALATSFAFANDQISSIDNLSVEDAKYFEIASVNVEDVSNEMGVCPDVNTSNELVPFQSVDTIADLAVKLDEIVNLGQKVWNLVEAGKPVMTTQWQTASAIPQGVTNWDQMAGWKMPESRAYRVRFVNVYGMTMVDFVYRLNYTFGGSYKGQGQYLTRVSAMSESLAVAWGFNFDGSVEVQSVANGGTTESPIALMELIVKWKMKTPVRVSEGSSAYAISGDGTFKAL